GNEDTGFTYIRNRHNYYSDKDYWRVITNKNGKEILNLEDPSRFSKYSIPIIHYTEIADSIFKSENRNFEKNKNPEFFDMYSGNYEHPEGVSIKYHLITYKNTPIIHTLFPNERKFNRKKVINLVRGGVHGEENLKDRTKTIFIPYKDAKLTKYTILIRKEYMSSTELIFIMKHDKNGNPEKIMKITEREVNTELSIQHELTRYEYSDLTNFEKIIRQLMKEDGDI
ncbi:MAG: hypothetical protein SFU99_05685, partial [Saprospiraceae bacterium]|nr:hypothetical protein [Saprospiraceae bacterium]